MDLSNLRRPEGANRNRKRRGRGPGSGTGKTAGRGHKGHKARSGNKHKAYFEGGQMPLQRRVPKRGFTPRSRTVWQVVNVRDLEGLEEKTVTPAVLHEHGLADLGRDAGIKVLGTGELTRKITVQAHAFSAGAREKIEAAGGSVELVED
ncbi:MAG: 50S ribosomal protein L15 [Gemmatimonadota bacterium]